MWCFKMLFGVKKVTTFLARRENHFQRKNCPKRIFCSDFVKLGLEILLFVYFWQKNCRFFYIAIYFFWFWLAFKKLKLLSSEELGRNYSMFGLGIAQPLQNSYSAGLLDLQRCNWQLLDGRSVLDTIIFQNEVQKVLYKLVLVTDSLDHCARIYSPSNFGIVVVVTKE